MNEFIKQVILSYYKEKWNMPYLTLEQFPFTLRTGMYFYNYPSRRKGRSLFHQNYMNIMYGHIPEYLKSRPIIFLKKRRLTGIHPGYDYFFPKDKNGIPYDPEIGPMPDNIKELWEAAKPKMNNDFKGVPLIFGTGGEISSSGLYEQAMKNMQESIVCEPMTEAKLEAALIKLAKSSKKNSTIQFLNIPEPERSKYFNLLSKVYFKNQ